jgi:AGCS family alanine or glycine:cation symporter
MEILERLTDWLWSGPILFALLFTHLYMTVKLKVPQRTLPLALKLSVSAVDEGQHQTAVREGFRALAMTLAATLGTGNIVGVSTAVVLGGPGAVLWCWLTGVLGMATAYGECYLGMLYRERDEEGHFHGGPMYALEKGLKNHRLAVVYAACVVVSAFGIGAGTQSGALAGAVQAAWQVDEGVTGVLAALLTGLVILGGVKSIGRWCERLVPVAGICYIGGCLCILVLSGRLILPALGLIIKSAFTPMSICAGVAGGGLSLSLRYGVARGLFTNEAGLGTASISAATSSAPPKTQSLIQMSAVFWDTVVMCALTGLVVVVGLLDVPVGQGQPELTAHAFSLLPVFGTDFLAVCMVAFALATLIGWSYFGEEACRFLHLPALGYKLIYLFMIFAGAVLPMKLVWCVTDLVNALLIIPSLVCLYGLGNQIEGP